MAIFDIGKGATFGGPDQLSYFDATKGLASLANRPDDAYKRQNQAFRMMKPIRDEITGVEILSPALMSKYQNLMGEHGLSPDFVNQAQSQFIATGDMSYINDLSTRLHKFKGDPRTANILRANEEAAIFQNDIIGNDKLQNVRPIIANAWEDHMETGSTKGFKLPYEQIDISSVISAAKKEATTSNEATEYDKENRRRYTKKITTRNPKQVKDYITNRFDTDPSFRANFEGIALSNNIPVRDQQGNYTNEFFQFADDYVSGQLENWGGEDVDIQAATDMTVAEMVQAGIISKEEAATMSDDDKFTAEQIAEVLSENDLEDNAVNRAVAKKILKGEVSSSIMSDRLKKEETKTSKGRDPESAYDRQRDPDAWAKWMESQGVNIPKNDIGYYHEIWKDDYDQNTTEFLEDEGTAFAPKETKEEADTKKVEFESSAPKERQIVQGTGVPLPEISTEPSKPISVNEVPENLSGPVAKVASKFSEATYGLGKKTKDEIDCSGLVCAVLSDLGIKTSVGTSEQTFLESDNQREYEGVDDVNFDELKEGSIIALDTGVKDFDRGREFGIDHIGIVTVGDDGEKYIIESASSKGGFAVSKAKDRLRELNESIKKIFVGDFLVDNEYDEEQQAEARTPKIDSTQLRNTLDNFIRGK